MVLDADFVACFSPPRLGVPDAGPLSSSVLIPSTKDWEGLVHSGRTREICLVNEQEKEERDE